MSTRPLDAALAGAEAGLQNSQAYQPRKSEKRYNAISMYLDILSTANVNSSYLGDGLAARLESQTVTTIRDTVTSPDFDAVADYASDLLKYSKILVDVLDEVASVHPFVKCVSYLASTLSAIVHSSRSSCGYSVQSGGRARNRPTRE